MGLEEPRVEGQTSPWKKWRQTGEGKELLVDAQCLEMEEPRVEGQTSPWQKWRQTGEGKEWLVDAKCLELEEPRVEGQTSPWQNKRVERGEAEVVGGCTVLGNGRIMG